MQLFLSKTESFQRMMNKQGVHSKKIKKTPKNYKILDSKDFISLNEFYLKNIYPSKEELQKLSLGLSQPVEKIRNWFKHQRSKEVKSGKIKYTKKYAFSKKENDFLIDEYLKNPNPTSKDYEIMTNKLQCQSKNIKHWFAYRRKLALKNSNLKLVKSNSQELTNDDEHISQNESPNLLNNAKFINMNNFCCENKSTSFVPCQNLNQNIVKPHVVILAIPVKPQPTLNFNMINNNLLNCLSNAYVQLRKNQEYFSAINTLLTMK